MTDNSNNSTLQEEDIVNKLDNLVDIWKEKIKLGE